MVVTISDLPEEVVVELVLLRASPHETIGSFLCSSRSHSRLGQHAAFGLYHVSARVIQRQVREYFRYLRVKRCPLVVNPTADYDSIFEATLFDCFPFVRSVFLKNVNYPNQPTQRYRRRFEAIMRARFEKRQNGSWIVPPLEVGE